jgi:hypothetical protein
LGVRGLFSNPPESLKDLLVLYDLLNERRERSRGGKKRPGRGDEQTPSATA